MSCLDRMPPHGIVVALLSLALRTYMRLCTSLRNHSEIRDGKVVVLDGVLDKAQLAAARMDVGRLHDGGR